MKVDAGSRHRHGRWTVLVVAAMLAGIEGQERRPMEGLAIATFPVEPAVISGESLPFRTVLENGTARPLEVPSGQSASPFIYELRPLREGRGYILSAANRDRRRSPGPPPRETVQLEPLAPRQRAERIEDLADLINEGIDPAEYFVTVQYPGGNITSPKAVVTVLPMHVESLSSVVNGASLTSALADRRVDGGITLLQRDSLPDPTEGVFYRRQVLPAGSPVSVATAISLVPAGSGTWFGWLRDRMLTASIGWGNRTIFTSEPVRVDATQPELLDPAFQIAGGEALFGIIGRSGENVRLTVYQTADSGLKQLWTAALTSTGAASVHWNCQPDGSVTVVWQEPASGRLLSRDFQADGRPKDAAPRVRTSSRPAAWSVTPSGTLAISVLGLFEGSYRYARLGAQSMADPKPIAELPGVTGWGFLAAGDGVTIVAATPTGISQTRPGGAWESVVKTEKPLRLHAFQTSKGAHWVEWVQTGYGIRRARLP